MTKQKKRKILCISGIFVLLVMVYMIFQMFLICHYCFKDETTVCDVGIVLGAAANDNTVSEVYRQRLNHALECYKNGLISKVIVTGGTAKGNQHSDAYMAKCYLVEQGVPKEDILLEENSTITQENVSYSKKIMKENHYDSALIISDPLHMKRAMLMAKDVGIDAFSSPTTTSAYKSLKTKIPFVMRETFFYIGYQWYRIFIL